MAWRPWWPGLAGTVLGAFSCLGCAPSARERHCCRYRADVAWHWPRLFPGQAVRSATGSDCCPRSEWDGGAIFRRFSAALEVNVFFLIGLLMVPLMAWFFATRVGVSSFARRRQRDAARAVGFPVNRVRFVCTLVGGFLAGVGGSFLSLYYPGSWNEGLSSGQGLMAVALVIFARWDPVRCL